MSDTVFQNMLLMTLNVLLLLPLLHHSEARVSSRASTTPACYVDNGYVGFFKCSNPLYTRCSDTPTLCCGPEHYCCGGGASCCSRTSLNGWELTGVITSTLSWVALLGVLSVLTAPRIQRRWRKFQNSVKPWSKPRIGPQVTSQVKGPINDA